ncbi:hypothetical protein BJ925_0314 [Rahnella aquatilis]|nr:hypothetical protein BJ925_0314 [Rahnella aquatilis]
MKTYIIDFKCLNVNKDVITCTAFVRSETLFLAINSFEEKNRGRGYVAMSARELDNTEISAINSLKKNVAFWFDECGLSKEGVLSKINAWFNFAFTTDEQNEAKKEIIGILKRYN